MDKQQLMHLLPHRDPMLLLDEAELDGELARGKRLIRGDEWFLQGHFPENPVVPGVILCEILAQSACVLLGRRVAKERLPTLPAWIKSGLNIRFGPGIRSAQSVGSYGKRPRSISQPANSESMIPYAWRRNFRLP